MLAFRTRRRSAPMSASRRAAIAAWLVSAVALPAAGAWEVRFAQQPDQKPEWTAAGYLPAWTIVGLDPAADAISWTESEPGACRGWLLFGRELTLPTPLPRELSIRLEYQTYCAISRPEMQRSGLLAVFAMRRSVWNALAREPASAASLTLSDPEVFLATATVHGQGEDVEDWRAAGPVSLRLPGELPGGETIVVGVAWGAYHYADIERGAFRAFEVSMVTQEELERRFWAALDLNRPELAAVRDALAADDFRAATTALAAHLRTRATPVVGRPLGPADERTLRAADDCLAGTYRRLAGCPDYTFPDGKVVWNADPFHYDQWAIALNRHGEWTALAAAWLATSDDRYAAGWAALLRDWVTAMPVHIGSHWIQGPYNEPGRSPLSLDAGIRMGQTWFRTFDVLRRSPAVDDATIVTFARSCYDHALYLMRSENFHSGSNWGAMEANGLYHIGVLLPEFSASATWRETAMARLTAEIDAQVYPDGAQQELAPGYHGVSLGNFLGAMHLANANGLPLPPAYVSGLERMFDYYLRIALPDLTYPALNDSGRGSISGHLREAVTLFPDREDFRWAASGRKEGRPPEYTSTVMPYAGWVIQRTGWEPTDSWLLFDAGPFGTGHQHEDKLAIQLYAHGRLLLTDAGNYAYDTSAWRRYVLSTRGHSTIRIDGQDQACRLDRSEYRATAPDTHGFRTDEHFDYARSTHTAGYGQGDRTVVHRRRVLFVKPDYWLVVDDLAASDDVEHTAAAQFLIDASEATVLPDTKAILSVAGADGARIAILPLGPNLDDAQVVSGQVEPEVMGFIPEGFEKLRPAPAAIYTARFRVAARMAFLLVPFTGEAPPVAVATARQEGDRTVVELSLPGERRHTLEIALNGLTAHTGLAEFAADEPPLGH